MTTYMFLIPFLTITHAIASKEKIIGIAINSGIVIKVR